MEDKHEIRWNLWFHWRFPEKIEFSKRTSFVSLFVNQNNYKMYVYEILRSFRMFYYMLIWEIHVILFMKQLLWEMLPIIWHLSSKVAQTSALRTKNKDLLVWQLVYAHLDKPTVTSIRLSFCLMKRIELFTR